MYLVHTRLDHPPSSPQQAHKMMWDIIHGGKTVKKRDFLFRVDGDHAIVMLPSPPGHFSKKEKIVMVKKLSIPCQGQELGYRIRFNPRICVGGRKRGVGTHAWKTAIKQGFDPPTATVTALSAISEWFIEKGCANGFKLLSMHGAISKECFRASKDKITLDSADFWGRLKVTDEQRFHEALSRGIGSAKAYGFGLLLISNNGE